MRRTREKSDLAFCYIIFWVKVCDRLRRSDELGMGLSVHKAVWTKVGSLT